MKRFSKLLGFEHKFIFCLTAPQATDMMRFPFSLKRSARSQSRNVHRLVQLVQQDGKLQIEGANAWYRYWRDPYHLILMTSWVWFSVIVSLVYILLNVFFAILYLCGGDCLQNARPASFEDAFFFSVQSLSTIGYGDISPKTAFANSIVLLEAITGQLVTAVVTGLSFARFTKPTDRIVFSKVAVIAPYNQIPTLMFRVVNQRHNNILDTQLRVYLLKEEVTDEGRSIYRIHELTLLQERAPTLLLSWMALHPVDQDSPLNGMTAESLARDNAQIIVSLNGVDNTVSYTLNLQHIYAAHEILFNYCFKDIVYIAPNGIRRFDFDCFHQVIPIQPTFRTGQTCPTKRNQGLGLA